MSARIGIDLCGIEFRESGRSLCNDCRFDFDQPDCSDVPLRLFSEDGKKMAVLCMLCAEIRMGKAFAE